MEGRQTLGERGLIDRGQFVRLILESLHSLGYADAADALEEESRTLLFPPEYHQLGHLISSGRWEDCIRIIETKECFKDLIPENRCRACFSIWKQCFLELLASQDTDAGRLDAIQILRHRIAPLAHDDSEVHSLALSIITSDPSHKLELIQRRGELFKDVLRDLGNWIRVPERRLESLVEMASVGQQKSCMYHNMPIGQVTLYEDHCCSYEAIPWQCSQILNNHRNEVAFLKFSNNGLYLASSSNRGVIIWQVEENTDRVLMRFNIKGYVRPGPSIAWSPDDSKLLTSGIGLFKIWDVQTGRSDTINTRGIGWNMPNSFAWLPDSREFVCGSRVPVEAVYTLDLAGQNRGRLEGPSIPDVLEIAVTPDGQHLISIYSDSFIRIRNLQTREKIDIRESGSITSLSLSGDGRHLIVNLGHDEIHLWSVRSPHNPPEIYRGHKQANHFTWSCFGGSNSMFLASGSKDSSIYIWHRGDYDKPVLCLNGHLKAVNCVSWNPTKPHMLASAGADHTIRIWMAGRGQHQ